MNVDRLEYLQSYFLFTSCNCLIHSAHHLFYQAHLVPTFLLWLNTLHSPLFFKNPPFRPALLAKSTIPTQLSSAEFLSVLFPTCIFFLTLYSLDLSSLVPACCFHHFCLTATFSFVFLISPSYSCWYFESFCYFYSNLDSLGTLRHCLTSSSQCKSITPPTVFYCILRDPRIIVCITVYVSQ